MSYYYSYPYGPSTPTSTRYQQPTYYNPTPEAPLPPAGLPFTPGGAADAAPSGPPIHPIQVAQATSAVNDYMANNSNRAPGNYVDNILHYNKGKLVKIHMTFNSGGGVGESKVFTGIIEANGRDHIVLSDPKTGHRYVLLTIYLDYIEFPEEINYYYPGNNTLNVADPDFLEKHPEIEPLYNFKKQQKETFINKLNTMTAAPRDTSSDS